MYTENENLKDRILQAMDRYLAYLTDRGVITTGGAAENYAYSLCFLKAYCERKQMEPAGALLLAEDCRAKALERIGEADLRETFQEEADVLDRLYALEDTAAPAYDKAEFLFLRLPDDNIEVIYSYLTVKYWTKEKEAVRPAVIAVIEALYDSSVSLLGYNTFAYRLLKTGKVLCRVKSFDGKYGLPADVTTIEKGAFDRVAITGTFVIPKTVELIESNAFDGVVFDELVFEPRETELRVKIFGIIRSTIKSGILHIPERVRLDNAAIQLSKSAIVYPEASLEEYADLTGMPVAAAGSSLAAILYVVRDDIDSPHLAEIMKHEYSYNHVLLMDENDTWLVDADWFRPSWPKVSSYKEYVNQNIETLSGSLDLLLDDHLIFMQEHCLPLLDSLLTDAGCWRMLAKFQGSICVRPDETVRQAVLSVVNRFGKEQDFLEEFFEIRDGVLVDYVPRRSRGDRHYTRVPEGVREIKNGAFHQVDVSRDAEYLYLPKSLVTLEERCLEPFTYGPFLSKNKTPLKKLYCFGAYDQAEFARKYLKPDYEFTLVNMEMARGAADNTDALEIDGDTLKRCSPEAVGTVFVPEGVCSIAEKAFEDCDLVTEIRFPKSVSQIGAQCFDGCGLLGSLVFDDDARFFMDPSAWEKAPMLRERYKEEQVIIFGRTLVKYMGRKEREYTVPEEVRIINTAAFSNRNMQRIRFAGSIERIGDCAFASNENLREIRLPFGLREIGNHVFEKCSLQKIVFPEQFTFVPEELREKIGDQKIGMQGLFAFSDDEKLDVYVDDKFCGEGHSFEYQWETSPVWERTSYKVRVFFRPLQEECKTLPDEEHRK
ncbi:MAG: leucine-rich repeat domain-containing protein [Eubacterium sp.]|nr:leucine-rich repeat domain-containing protein [Eubacterium sp.]